MTRRALLVLAVVVAGTCIWLVHRSHVHRVTIRTHFHNAQGLKPKAKVRANGLEVGEVKDVSLDPSLREQPVEVLLKLDSRYAATIPDDSTATIATAGLLGEPYVEIDVSNAAGGPIASNGVLKGVDAGSAPLLQIFLNAISEQSKQVAEESEKLRQAIDSHNALAEQSKKLAEESEKLRQTIDSQNSRTKKRAPKPAGPN